MKPSVGTKGGVDSMSSGAKRSVSLSTRSRLSAFTIVELLIVIVIIGILAAISIVAYNGIQNRANDTAVQNDIASMARQVHLLSADTGEFMSGGSSNINLPAESRYFPDGFTFAASKNSYMTSVNNLYYCEGINTSGERVFRLGGRSKSGNVSRYDSSIGFQESGDVHMGTTSMCGSATLSDVTITHGYSSGMATWWDWVTD